MFNLILILALLTIPASAVEYRNDPPPLPKKQRSCLWVVKVDKCVNVEPEVLRLYGMKSGDAVTFQEMLDIDVENRAFLKFRQKVLDR